MANNQNTRNTRNTTNTNRGAAKAPVQNRQQKPTQAENLQQSWNTITGVMRIWGQEFSTQAGGSIIVYSTQVSAKDKNEEWHNQYLNVRFSQNAGRPDKTGEIWISITNSFLTLGYNDRIELVVTEYEEV